MAALLFLVGLFSLACPICAKYNGFSNLGRDQPGCSRFVGVLLEVQMEKPLSSGPDKPNQIFYAHSDPEKPGKTPEEGANWQLLEEHLKETAELARTFAS